MDDVHSLDLPSGEQSMAHASERGGRLGRMGTAGMAITAVALLGLILVPRGNLVAADPPRPSPEKPADAPKPSAIKTGEAAKTQDKAYEGLPGNVADVVKLID